VSDLMLRDVFRRTIYDQRRALLGYGIGLLAFTAMISGIWPTVRDQGEDFQKLLDSYPPALKAAFDIGSFDGAGFLKGEMFSFMLPVLFLIFAIGRGADLIAGEEERGALDMLLAQPVPRRRALLQKAAGLLVGLAILAMVVLLPLAIVVRLAGFGVSVTNLASTVFMLFLLASFFGIGALTMGAVKARRGVAIGVAAAVAAATYFLQVAARLVPSTDAAKWASPFYYYSGGDPLVEGLRLGHALALAVATAALLAVAVWAFERRDIGV